jgi:hypothetical protein
MVRSIKQEKRKRLARKTYRRKGGGKTFASSTPVSLSYNGQAVTCELCRQNHYTENIGTLGKSKIRSGVTSFFFGDAGEVLDTTSIITYFCNNCGLSKTIRNNDAIKIISGPLRAPAPAPVQEQPEAQSKEQEQRKPEQTAP